MGHINFAQFMIDRKGITDRVTLNGMTLMNWETTPLPMNDAFIEKLKTTPANRMIYNKPCNFFSEVFHHHRRCISGYERIQKGHGVYQRT